MPTVAKSKATPAKMPSNVIIRRACPSACVTTTFIACGWAIAIAGSIPVNAACTSFVTASGKFLD